MYFISLVNKINVSLEVITLPQLYNKIKIAFKTSCFIIRNNLLFVESLITKVSVVTLNYSQFKKII